MNSNPNYYNNAKRIVKRTQKEGRKYMNKKREDGERRIITRVIFFSIGMITTLFGAQILSRRSDINNKQEEDGKDKERKLKQDRKSLESELEKIEEKISKEYSHASREVEMELHEPIRKYKEEKLFGEGSKLSNYYKRREEIERKIEGLDVEPQESWWRK